MPIPKLNKCRQCGGYMFFDADPYGYYAKCLQCSYWVKLKIMAKSDGKPAQMDKELALGQTQKSPSSRFSIPQSRIEPL